MYHYRSITMSIVADNPNKSRINLRQKLDDKPDYYILPDNSLNFSPSIKDIAPARHAYIIVTRLTPFIDHAR